MKSLSTPVLAFVAVLAIACGGNSKKETTTPAPAATDPAASPASDKSLFERLGGLPAITAVVDELLVNVMADERINARFANTDAKRLRQMLIDQICEATGGGPIVGCKYVGRNMVESHTGMKVTDAEFDALVEDLVKALDKFAVPEREKGELLGALGAMRPDIVNR